MPSVQLLPGGRPPRALHPPWVGSLWGPRPRLDAARLPPRRPQLTDLVGRRRRLWDPAALPPLGRPGHLHQRDRARSVPTPPRARPVRGAHSLCMRAVLGYSYIHLEAHDWSFWSLIERAFLVVGWLVRPHPPVPCALDRFPARSLTSFLPCRPSSAAGYSAWAHGGGFGNALMKFSSSSVRPLSSPSHPYSHRRTRSRETDSEHVQISSPPSPGSSAPTSTSSCSAAAARATSARATSRSPCGASTAARDEHSSCGTTRASAECCVEGGRQPRRRDDSSALMAFFSAGRTTMCACGSTRRRPGPSHEAARARSSTSRATRPGTACGRATPSRSAGRSTCPSTSTTTSTTTARRRRRVAARAGRRRASRRTSTRSRTPPVGLASSRSSRRARTRSTRRRRPTASSSSSSGTPASRRRSSTRSPFLFQPFPPRPPTDRSFSPSATPTRRATAPAQLERRCASSSRVRTAQRAPRTRARPLDRRCSSPAGAASPW